MSRITRRAFLKGSAAVAGSSLLLNTAKSYGQIAGANERFRIGVAGLHGRGGSHVSGWMEQPNVEVAWLADVDSQVLSKAIANVTKKSGGKYTPQGTDDVRKALEDKNLDAISVATPNHWHSLITIWGAQAGKNVYVEKPMSHDVHEGRVAYEVSKKYGVVVQHGTQSRSSAQIAGLHEAIKAGKFGKLVISYGYCCKPREGIGFKPFSDPPAGLNWDMWRGPAMIEKFHANFVHYNWHWFWVTGNGDMNNQGTHQLDIAQWALSMDNMHPTRAMALGGRFKWKDQGETPNTMFGIAEYANGQQVFFNVRNVNYKGYVNEVMNEYYFEDGGKISRGKYYPKGSDKGEVVKVPPGKVTPGGNWAAFIAASRAKKPEMANGTAYQAHVSCVLGHLMNNSYRLGEKVPFNAKAGRFGDNKAAAEHFLKLHEIMRDGVGIPEDKEDYIVGPWLTFDGKTEQFTGEHAEAANKLLSDPRRPGFELPAI
jgi:predicted dehydrogenase